jgi:hypothetical protein
MFYFVSRTSHNLSTISLIPWNKFLTLILEIKDFRNKAVVVEEHFTTIIIITENIENKIALFSAWKVVTCMPENSQMTRKK